MSPVHLRYDLYTAPSEHALDVMRALGITYAHATPQSIADEWWFWHCVNTPDPLPAFLTPLNVTPTEAIGYGLSAEDAKRLTDLA